MSHHITRRYEIKSLGETEWVLVFDGAWYVEERVSNVLVQMLPLFQFEETIDAVAISAGIREAMRRAAEDL